MDIIDLYREHINPDADAVDIFNLFNIFNIGPGYVYTEDVDNKIFKYIQKQNTEQCIKWIIDNSIKNRAKNYMRLKDGYKERYTIKDFEQMIHQAVNDSHCGPNRITQPNSNNCAEFVNNWINEYKKK